jgi:hypothetical protein
MRRQRNASIISQILNGPSQNVAFQPARLSRLILRWKDARSNVFIAPPCPANKGDLRTDKNFVGGAKITFRKKLYLISTGGLLKMINEAPDKI